MPWCRVTPVYNPDVRKLCVRAYPGHPRGCPNFGKKTGCPPKAPLLPDVFDMERPFYAIWNVFDFAAHVAKMKTAHPDWSDRQLANCLYWQAGARKKLTEEIDRFLASGLVEPSMTMIERCPEAMGLDVTATMAAAGGRLQWPPETRAVQIALAGWRK